MSAADRRGDVARARRLVVKVGSSSLTTTSGGIAPGRKGWSQRKTWR